MILHVKDNFLDVELFQQLRNNMIDEYSSAYIPSKEKLWFKRLVSESGNLNDIRSQCGLMWYRIVKQIQEYAFEVSGKMLIPHGLRYQITNSDPETYGPNNRWHLDGAIRGQELKDSYTSIIYCSVHNTENCGAYWSNKDLEYAPLPNRLIFYSRDVLHAMTPPTVKWDEPRMICLISWST